MTQIDYILTILELTDEEKKKVIECTGGGTLRRLMSTKEELLKSELKYCAGAIIDFQAWYRKFRETDKETDLKKAFTIEVWDE